MRENSVKCINNAPLSRRNIKFFSRIRLDPRMSKSGTVIKDQFQFQIQFFCLSPVSVTHLSKHCLSLIHI